MDRAVDAKCDPMRTEDGIAPNAGSELVGWKVPAMCRPNQAADSSCGRLRPEEKGSGSGWESNPPGPFSEATPGLKPGAVTRSAYTPEGSRED